MNNKLGRAIEIAASAHINQIDKGGNPYDSEDDSKCVNKNSILNSYPLKNIK